MELGTQYIEFAPQAHLQRIHARLETIGIVSIEKDSHQNHQCRQCDYESVFHGESFDVHDLFGVGDLPQYR